jgi:hypothetical protein
LNLARLLPGGSRSFLALVARLALGSCLDEAALFGCLGGRSQGGHYRSE